jgi:hypothetical protein
MRFKFLAILLICLIPFIAHADLGLINGKNVGNVLKLTSAEVNATTWTLTFPENVTVNGSGTGWSASCSTAGVITLTYASGTGTDTLTYTGSPTVAGGDTCTITYTPPASANMIRSGSSNDLLQVVGHVVTVGGGGYATPALLGSGQNYSSSITYNRQSASSTLVVFITGSNGTSTLAGGSLTYNLGGAYTPGSYLRVAVYVAANNATGNITIEATGTMGDMGLAVHEYSNLAASPIGNTATDLSAGAEDASVDTADITKTQASGVLVAVYGNENTVPRTFSGLNTGWSQVLTDGTHQHTTFHKIYSADTAEDFKATLDSGAESWGVIVVDLKAAAL